MLSQFATHVETAEENKERSVTMEVIIMTAVRTNVNRFVLGHVTIQIDVIKKLVETAD